jgi:uncharacterized protein (TIGR02217 family)
MAFLDSPRFPENVSKGAQGGPEFSTDVVVLQSGAESRTQNWAAARRKYEVSHAARLASEYDPLKAFFHVVGGRAIGFRFKDWSDYIVPAGTGFFSPIDSTHFQLVKRYTVGASIHDRTITKPVSGATTIAGSGNYTLDYTTGILLKNSGADPSSWGGEFDVPCRFDTDEMRGEIIDKTVAHSFIIAWNAIPIVEIRDIA